MNKKEILEEVNSILENYSRLVGRFSHLYEQLDDETADLVTKAGIGKWLDYAFTESMDELYFRALSWELEEQDLEDKEAI